MLKIKVTYNNSIVFEEYYPADKFTVGFQNEILYTLEGNQSIALELIDTYCGQSIYIANKILDNKDNVFSNEIIIESKVVILDNCLQFSDDSAFSLSANKGWNGTIEYSRDLEKWYVWQGSNITAKQYDSKYYLFLRGDSSNTRISNINSTWHINGQAACDGDIIHLFGGICNPETGALSYWFKDQNIISLPIFKNIKLTDNIFESAFENCQLINDVPELPFINIPKEAYKAMFKNSSISRLPIFPSNVVNESAYEEMFYGSQIKLSKVKNTTYKYPISFPAYGEVQMGLNWNKNMIKNTQGTFTDNPQASQIYYTDVEPLKSYNIISYNNNGGTGFQPNDVVFNNWFILPRPKYHKEYQIAYAWDFSTNTDSPLYINSTYRIDKDVCLYPQWKQPTYPVHNLKCEFLCKGSTEDTSDNNVVINNYYTTSGGRDGEGCLKIDRLGTFSINPCGKNNWTVSFWINTDGNLTVPQNIIYFGQSDSNLLHNSVQFVIQKPGNLSYQFRLGSSEIEYNLSPNKWYNITVEQDVANNLMKVYIDGKLYYTFNKILDGAYGSLCLGNGNIFSNAVCLDNIRIYDEVLSESEIINLYNNG